MANFAVTNSTDNGQGDVEGSLSWAIASANAVAGDDIITLETDVTLTGEMQQLIDSNVTVNGSGSSSDGDQARNISGNNTYRPLFIKSGNVTIRNVDINNGLAKGENGNAGGGGGAGLGGGLFIYSGNVKLSNVDIENNAAVGGDGGSSGFGGGGGFSPLFSGGAPGVKGADGEDGGNGGDGGFGSGGGIGGDGGDGLYIIDRVGYYTEEGDYGYDITRDYKYRGGDTGNGGLGGFGGGGGAAGFPGYVDYTGGYYGAPVFSYTTVDGAGGFGGGDGRFDAYFGRFSAYADEYFGGGGGAGLGGGVFIRAGSLTLEAVDFVGNSAVGGYGSDGYSPETNGDGFGGGLFALHITENTNGNNVDLPDILPVVNISSATFVNNTATDAGSSNEEGIGRNLDNNAVFGTTTELIDLNVITGTNSRDILVGTAGADRISGLGGNDRLIGDRGNDILNGAGGNDILKADAGNDILNGGRGNDKLFGGTGNDELTGSSGNDLLQGDAGNDLLNGGQGKDKLVGDRGDDELIGGTGNDRLIGGTGNDRLIGGEGRDVLIGGSGQDIFVIGSGGRLPVRDVIKDFRAGQDKIELTGLSFGALSFRGNRISIADTDEAIAALTGIDATTLTAADFA